MNQLAPRLLERIVAEAVKQLCATILSILCDAVFLQAAVLSMGLPKVLPPLVLFRISWTTLAYALFMWRPFSALIGMPSYQGICLVLALAGVFCLIRIRQRGAAALQAFRMTFLYEMAVIPLVLYALFGGRVELSHAVFYHLVFWLVLPIVRSYKVPSKVVQANLRNVGSQVLVTILFLLLAQSEVIWHWFFANTYRGGYIRVGMTFFLSKANPRWVTSFFSSRSPQFSVSA